MDLFGPQPGSNLMEIITSRMHRPVLSCKLDEGSAKSTTTKLNESFLCNVWMCNISHRPWQSIWSMWYRFGIINIRVSILIFYVCDNIFLLKQKTTCNNKTIVHVVWTILQYSVINCIYWTTELNGSGHLSHENDQVSTIWKGYLAATGKGPQDARRMSATEICQDSISH